VTNSYNDAEDPQQPAQAPVSDADEQLLIEIRDRYTYYDGRWKEPRDERNTDMRYIAGDPWEEEDRRARKDAGRPCISHDELSQYVNSCVNSVRQTKKGIRVEPRGGKSSAATAEFRQNLIRAIEYENEGPATYIGTFQQMVEGSYGFFRVGTRYVSNDIESNDANLFDQEITIGSIPNPNSVLYDPDCKTPDWSDPDAVFVLEPMPKEEFKRRFPRAQITDFQPEHLRIAKDWIQDKKVVVAEYWKIVTTSRMKYLLADGSTVMDKPPKGAKVKDEREVARRTPWQFMTNGIEILKRKEFKRCKYIPIIPMIGLERYLDQGGITRRELFSLVRLARDPQMSLAYLVSQQMEEAGLTPKTPYKGYVGQFETDKTAIEECTKIPHSYLQFDAKTDATGDMILPLPARENFTPNFQAYEIAKDSCRRAVQAAMGISPLPTAAQRDNQKSGIALEKVKEQQEIGSWHFVDGFDRALAFAGRVIDERIPVVYDTERDMTLRKPDDSPHQVRVNTESPYADETGEMVHYPIVDGVDHAITTSDGPSYASQMEAASDFIDLLIQSLPTLPIPPPQAAKILALAIQMKQLGPKGDEIAEIVSPTDAGQAGQMQQQIGQAQAALAQQGQALQAMQAELQKLQLEKSGRVIDNQFKLQIETMRQENALAIAEVETKAQSLSERMEFVTDLAHKFLDSAHDVGLQAQDHANAQQAAQQAQQHQQSLQSDAQNAAAQQQATAQQPEPEPQNQ
jgi:hypothetical protein